MKTMLALCGLTMAVGAAQAGWSNAGDVLPGPGNDLVLTTAWLAPGDPDAPFNLSGQSAVDIALVERRAGVAAYALDLGEQAATEGSVAWRRLDVAAGDALSFDWAFGSTETEVLDHAFAVLDGQVFTLATSGSGATAGHFGHVFGAAAVVSFAVGVVDTVDVLGVSTLQLGNLALTPAVPEPGPLWLLLAGGPLLLRRCARPPRPR